MLNPSFHFHMTQITPSNRARGVTIGRTTFKLSCMEPMIGCWSFSETFMSVLTLKTLTRLLESESCPIGIGKTQCTNRNVNESVNESVDKNVNNSVNNSVNKYNGINKNVGLSLKSNIKWKVSGENYVAEEHFLMSKFFISFCFFAFIFLTVRYNVFYILEYSLLTLLLFVHFHLTVSM